MAAFRILSFLIGFIPVWFGVNGLLLSAAEHMGGDAFTPAMDNQYRYLSGVYIGVAAMIFYSTGEIRKRARLFRFAMLFFFIGGCARVISYLTVGAPPTEQFAAMFVELLAPLLLLWQSRVLRY